MEKVQIQKERVGKRCHCLEGRELGGRGAWRIIYNKRKKGVMDGIQGMER
jgi:hypothetical protein